MRKKKPDKKTIESVAEEIIGIATGAFISAYMKHRRGESLEAILIDLDIRGAYHSTDKETMNIMRAASKAGVSALKANLGLDPALKRLQSRLEARYQQVLRDL
jgi:hypothetical protein